MKIRLKWLIPVVVVVMLVVARILAPPIIRDKINDYLASFSDTYYGHIEDFDLSIWRGAYRLNKVRLSLKGDNKTPFMTASLIDVSVAWREIFHGRILMDVFVDEVNLVADRAFTQTAKMNPKKSTNEAVDVGSKIFPVETERVEIKHSRIEYKDLGLFIDEVSGSLSNVTITEKNPEAFLSIRGNFLGKSEFKSVGRLNWLKDPAIWVFGAELQKQNLPALNSVINRYIPLTFKNGTIDVYAEVRSENNRIAGYIKPFLKDAEVVGDDKDFKGIKHFGVEITVAFLNMFFKSREDHILATRVLFTFENQKFQWNMVEVISKLFKNGYDSQLAPGLDNLLTLSEPEKKERKN